MIVQELAGHSSINDTGIVTIGIDSAVGHVEGQKVFEPEYAVGSGPCVDPMAVNSMDSDDTGGRQWIIACGIWATEHGIIKQTLEAHVCHRLLTNRWIVFLAIFTLNALLFKGNRCKAC